MASLILAAFTLRTAYRIKEIRKPRKQPAAIPKTESFKKPGRVIFPLLKFSVTRTPVRNVKSSWYESNFSLRSIHSALMREISIYKGAALLFPFLIMLSIEFFVEFNFAISSVTVLISSVSFAFLDAIFSFT